MNDLFTMKAYIQLGNDGEEEKKKIGKNKDKTPFGYPPISPSAVESRLFSGNLSGPKTSQTNPI